jgi:DNA invertase Pin-like site-specific DNA recombinase
MKQSIQAQVQVNFFHIFGALAKFERNLIRERTYAGLAAVRARGEQVDGQLH